MRFVELRDYKIKSLYDLEVSKEYRVELKEIKEGEKISLMSDVMLKAMFQNENRIKYSAKFLSYFINCDYSYILKNMTLGKNELDKEKVKTKTERCDYVAILNDVYLNIEVNTNSSLNILERNMEYVHRLFSRKIVVGDKKYEYTQCIQINLNNFSFKGNDKIVDIYIPKNNEGLALTKKLIYIQIYIPNLFKKWYTKGTEGLNELERYILTLVEPSVERIKDLGDDEVMKDYVKEAKKVSFEKDIGEAYDKEWARTEEARKEGLEKGANSKSREIAKKLLENNIDISVIIKSTGLSKTEINSLK